MVSREERLELNALSKEIFGVSSKWQKLISDGVTKVLTRKTTETVPGENGEPDTTFEVEVPVLTKSGAKQSYVHRMTVEEVKEMLSNLKAQRDAFFAEQKRLQEEAAAKKAQEDLEKSVHKEAMGSAV